MKGLLVLEDGTAYPADAIGRPGTSFGELVFNTAMSGYQEVLTDPSYSGQIVVMTAAHVGNYEVMLCERGVRTFADHTRNTLDLSAVPYVQRISHLPILVDPSHGTGKRLKVLPLSRASVAVGADGLLIEVHAHPESALSDGPQALLPEMFAKLVGEIRQLAPVLGRSA